MGGPNCPIAEFAALPTFCGRRSLGALSLRFRRFDRLVQLTNGVQDVPLGNSQPMADVGEGI